MAEDSPSAVDLLIKVIKPRLSSKYDAVFILVHAILQNQGFKLVGLGEDGERVEEKQLPDQWNTSQDSWSFRYRHSRSSMVFVVKAIRIQSVLTFYAFAVNEKDVTTLEVKVDSYVNEISDFSDISLIYRNVSALEELIVNTFCKKLLPSVEDLQQQQQSQQQQEGRREERREERDPNYDPLRVGPPRGPMGGGGAGFYPSPPSAYPGIGNEDLYPSFGGGIPGMTPPFGGGGGNVMGPNHPFFGRGGGGFPGGGFPGGGGAGNPFGMPPPPGARFDPFGPPASGIPPGPRPDHLRPPGWDDDSMFG